ncbi:MAG: PAS domain-containing sensor histidine kinase [Casimicrobiaceae bacterium]
MRSARRQARRPAGRVLLVFAPILALVALAAILAVAAWVQDSHGTQLLAAGGLASALAGVTAMLLLLREVRRRQTAHRAVRSLEARVSDIVESAMDPIISVDDTQRIVLFNAAAEKVFCWPRGAVLGQSLDKLIPERSRPAHRAHVERFGESGTTSRRMGSQTVLLALRADGGEFPIEASISHHIEDGRKFFTVIVRDITERVRAEELLTRSETRLRGVLDSAMDAIVTVDANQHIVLFNDAAVTMFGCSREEALGAPLGRFIPERMRATHAEHVRRFGETDTASRRMGSLRIVTGQRRNGEEFPIDASISQISELGTKFYTVILRDVTARMEAEAALKQSQAELQQQGAAADVAREQEKNRIARELHDELGQSLTMLQMDVAWCREKLPAVEDACARRLDRMSGLLSSTIAATRRIASDLRPLLLDDLGLLPATEWLVENFRQRTGIPCELAVSNPGMQLPGAHSTAVFRIVQEALTNITKHAQASHVEVAIDQHPAEIAVSIRDDGRGFSPQQPRKAGSFGLVGLRERAYLVGGQVTVTSSEGKGTSIEVWLPVPRHEVPS